MRIFSVNVKAGGLNKQIDALLTRAIAHEAQAYVFSEFRDTATGTRIRERMERAGVPHQAYTRGHRGNGVLVAADRPFERVHNPAGLPEHNYPNAMIECIFSNLHLIGVYLPGQDRKRPHLEYLISAARAMDEQGVAAVAIGDFNSGRNATDIEANLGRTRLADEFSTADLYDLLERQWHEGWLAQNPGRHEFSWYPRMGQPQRKNGWRLDKAFVSQAALPRLQRAFYDHAFRLEGLTDHSALIVDID